jgi:hypothetical protein
MQLMNNPRIFADFQNADSQGRLRLNCIGMILPWRGYANEDLSRQRTKLIDGENLLIYSEELEADAVVAYSDEEKIWVATIDWDKIREVAEVSNPSIDT